MNRVRTRYTSSPTGRIHMGNLRTALYAYLIVKHEDRDFLLRIKDTNQERYVEGAVEIIYQTLKNTGLIHDEGSDKDGDVGPYIQSERQTSGTYLEYTKKLVDKGEAYYCFCASECLSSLKKTMNGEEVIAHDKHCLGLSREEVEASLATGMPCAVRQNNPVTDTTTFRNEIYGDTAADNSELDDMVLIKSDGYPTYNSADVVNDHLMGITHVVRSNEYLSSSPKYNHLYEAFGWEVPMYVHYPLTTDEERHKLNKRSGRSPLKDLLEQGSMSEAAVNHMALLGWSPEDNRETFLLEEVVKEFDCRRMSKLPTVPDMTKFRRIDSEYMKAIDLEQFLQMAEPYTRTMIKEDLDPRKIASMVKTRIEVSPEIAGHIDFFKGLPEYGTAMYTHKKMKTSSETALKVLADLLPTLEDQEDYGNDALYSVLSGYVEETGVKTGPVMWPIRTAVSGKQMTSAGVTEIMEVLGKEEPLTRLRKGIEKLREQVNGGTNRSQEQQGQYCMTFNETQKKAI